MNKDSGVSRPPPAATKPNPASNPKSNLTRFKDALDHLCATGFAMLVDLELKATTEKFKNRDRLEKLRKPFQSAQYQRWYTEAQAVIRQVIPERLEEFNALYRSSKPRKEISLTTYTVEDGLLGLRVTYLGEDKFDANWAMRMRFNQQITILESAKARFESVLFDIRRVVQADIHDSEMNAARELLRNGYIRAAGVLAGVVLEAHLGEVAKAHNAPISKKDPTIGDLNEALKRADVYDLPTYRLIARLGDIRNVCGHKKSNEPTKDQVTDLLNGVDKVTHEVV